MKMARLPEKAHNVILSLLLIVLAGCGLYFVRVCADARNNEQTMQKLAPSQAGSALAAVSSGSGSVPPASLAETTQILPEFSLLRAQNSDIVGWLKIEQTNINCPVMQTPDDAEYYLHRNFNRQEEKRGLPFLDAATDLTHSANYLIYGHNMADGTAFADLVKYRSKEFWEHHPVISFDTLYEKGKYEVLAAFNSKVYRRDEKAFKYYQFTGPASGAEYSSYIANVKKLSLYSTGVEARYGDRLLTLSTCSNYTDDGRFAVVARKVSQ